jgi:hypothetical protein
MRDVDWSAPMSQVPLAVTRADTSTTLVDWAMEHLATVWRFETDPASLDRHSVEHDLVVGILRDELDVTGEQLTMLVEMTQVAQIPLPEAYRLLRLVDGP